jgi:hypothetical protein
MAEWHLKVLKKTSAHWPKESNEARLLGRAIAQKTAELAILRGQQRLRTGDVNSAVVEFTEAKRYHGSVKMTALILLLRIAPGLMRWLFRWRGVLLPTHKESTTR